MSNYDWFDYDGPAPLTKEEKTDKRIGVLEEKVDKINESLKPKTSENTAAVNIKFYDDKIRRLEAENEMLVGENQRLLAIISRARDELDD